MAYACILATCVAILFAEFLLDSWGTWMSQVWSRGLLWRRPDLYTSAGDVRIHN